jgi:Carboxypeptidase regulatory-like domain
MLPSRNWSTPITFAIALFCAGSLCLAQLSGNVQGTVTDPSGASVGGAQVNLHNTATSADSTTISIASGFYRFTSIAPGIRETERHTTISWRPKALSSIVSLL